MRLLALLALLAAGLFAGTLVAADEKKAAKDEDAILGTWQLDKIDVGDPKAPLPPAETLAKVTFTFKKDGKAVTVGPDGKEAEGEYKLDPAAKPKAIDVSKAGEKTMNPGIYEVDGDTLKVCLNQTTTTRPTEFNADGKGMFVMTFKRKKDEKKDK